MLAATFTPFPGIKTARLSLRKVTYSDAPEILKLRSNDSVMRYIHRDKASTLADAEIFIRRIDESLNNNDGITWGITFKDDPLHLIGTIGYWRMIREHYRAEIGYMLAPDHWKKGLMKEALTAVIDVGFNYIRLHSIEAHINPANNASASILAAAGFLEEAHFKENFFYNGTFHDTKIYSRLRSQESTTGNQKDFEPFS